MDSSSSTMDVDLSKENVVVVDSAAQTKILVFLQDDIMNLQGTSRLPWNKSTL